MGEKKVKGTMLVEQVRQIRANKNENWNEYLKPEDWEIIMQNILPSTWYPLETYQRCGWAVFNVLAGGDPELARLRGRERGKELFGGVYKGILKDENPMSALEGFVRISELFFSFSTLSFEKAGENHAILTHDYDPSEPANLPYCYTLLGHLESLVEMTGGQNVQIGFTSKNWEGDPVTTFDITWE